MAEQESKSVETLTEQMVLDYLQHNPQFLQRHPQLLEVLVPPEQQMGENVLDFQHYALENLQDSMRAMKDKFNGLLVSARDNMSVQHQVQQAVLQLLRARDLEHLLEVLTIDYVRNFDVDAVRLVIESDMAELYESYYSEQNYSGISFVPLQMVDMAMGVGKMSLLIPDTHTSTPYGYEQIFVDCSALIRSCALLRIHLDKIGRDGILAFGVRENDRFQSHQGVELLQFLAEVVEMRLDQCLSEHEIERLL